MFEALRQFQLAEDLGQLGKSILPYTIACAFWGVINASFPAFIGMASSTLKRGVPRLTAAYQRDSLHLMGMHKFISSRKAQASTLTAASDKPQGSAVY